MNQKKLGIGIVGLGKIARSHAAGYLQIPDRAEVRAVCDVDRRKAENFSKESGGIPYENLDEVIHDPDINMVDLILPHHLHYQAALKVIESGKHLIMEKPLAETYSASVEICDKARQAGIHFMVAENTRFVPGYVAGEKLLREGAIGKVNHVRTFLSSNEKARLSRPDFWGRQHALGGGLIFDTGAHTFYLLRWLLGPIKSLRAYSTQVFPIEGVDVEDTAEVYGTLCSGAHFECGFTQTSEIPHSERLELYGTEGGIIVDEMANPVVKVYSGHYDYSGRGIDEVAFGPDGWNPGGWHYESVVAEVIDFVDSIMENRPPKTDPYDCAYAIKVIEKAYQSIAEDRFVEVD